MHVTLPRQPLRQACGLPAERRRPSVQRREIDAVDPPDHTPPHVGVDRLVEVQARQRLRNEGAGHALGVQRYAGTVEEVVQPVIGPPEPSVGRPHVGRQPVVDRIGVAYSRVGPLAYPAPPLETVVVAVAVYRAPAVETLLRANADQAAGTRRAAPPVQPLGEPVLELVVPHLLAEKRETAARVTSGRHRANPQLPLALLPRAPVTLEHGGAGGHLERDADPIDVEDVGIRRQHPVHVRERVAVLDLVIHVKYADAAFQPVPPDVVDAEIEQHAAVLASGEGDVDVVEGLENGFQPPLCPLVDVHGRRFFPYSMATYSFHSRTGTNPSARNTSAWRVSVTERIV